MTNKWQDMSTKGHFYWRDNKKKTVLLKYTQK